MPTPLAPERADLPLRVAIVGFGRVGQAVTRRLLAQPRLTTGARPWRVVALADSHGCLLDPGGIDLAGALREKQRCGRLPRPLEEFEDGWSDEPPELLLELARSAPDTAEPGLRWISRALEHGSDVVTSDKSPIARRGRELRRLAARTGAELRCSTTVGGFVPVLPALRDGGGGAEVHRLTAIVNGTCQYVLNRVDSGTPFRVAVEEACERGLAERPPSWDLLGFDSAFKGAILHQWLFDSELAPEAVRREPLDELRLARRARAAGEGRRVAALLEVRPDAVELRLRPVSRGGPWDVTGAENVFCVETRHAGSVWLRGTGAGPAATASGVLADALALPRSRTESRPNAGRAGGWLDSPPGPVERSGGVPA
jgi:homoserine dehydrogenase